MDANNLYGWSTSQHLPYKPFKCMSTTDINNFHIHNIPIDSKYGYFLEVDLRGITCVNVDFQALFLIFRVSKLFRVFK